MEADRISARTGAPLAGAPGRGAFERLRRLLADRRGSVSLLTAIAAPLAIGFIALAADVSIWYSNQNSIQSAADLAAEAVATAVVSGDGAPRISTEAAAIAASNGFVNGQNGVTVAVNNPPTSGPFAGNAAAYEIVLTSPQSLFLGGVIGAVAPTIVGHSVVVPNASPFACIVALDPSAAGSLNLTGATHTTLPCDVYVNSTSASGVQIPSGSSFTGRDVYLAGDFSGGGSVSATNNLRTNAMPTSNPYAAYAIPSFSGCTYSNLTVSSAMTITPSGSSPVVFCGNVAVLQPLTLNPGVYIVDQGNFVVESALTATSGVTIIETSSTGSNIGQFEFSGASGSVSINAPSTGSTAGIALWVDPLAGASNQIQLPAGWTFAVDGALYSPGGEIHLLSNYASSASCVQLVADAVAIDAGAVFQSNQTCLGYGLLSPGASSSAISGILVQ